MVEFNARLQNAISTESEWLSNNPVLLTGELAFSLDKGYNFKIGDGTKTWSELSYASFLPLTGGNITGHVYLTGSKATSSTSNSSQLVFGTSSDNHVVLSSNNNALVINPTTSTTTNQIVLYLDKASVFPKGIQGNLTGTASKAVSDGNGNNIASTYAKKTVATTEADGLMSASDKAKLNAIAAEANKYTLPTATSNSLGGVKIGYSTSGKNYAVVLDKNNKMYVNVPWTDNNTTYAQANSSTLGLVKIGYTSTGKNYAVVLDADGKMYVNVPWVDTNTTYAQATDSTLGLVKIGYETSGKNYAVALDANGKMYVNVPWSDTKNTAGSTNNNTDTLYLVGAKSQVASATTYSKSQVYISGDGNLVSKTFNGYALAAACGKSVVDSTSAGAIGTGTSLTTERDVYYGLPIINGSHDYNSSTTLFAPTAVGTSGQVLTSSGNGAPGWINQSSLSVGKAATWTTARNFTIKDADSTNSGTAASVNGGAAVTLLLPSTIKATLSGNASTASKWATERQFKIVDGENEGAASSVDGSANISLSLPSTIKATLNGNASSASKVYVTLAEEAVEKTYHGVFRAGTASENDSLLSDESGFKYHSLRGTTSAEGHATLSLGNGTPIGTDRNRIGRILLMSSGNSGAYLQSSALEADTWPTHILPPQGGLLLNIQNSFAVSVYGHNPSVGMSIGRIVLGDEETLITDFVVPFATTSQAGVVTAGNQSFAGTKTFTGTVVLSKATDAAPDANNSPALIVGGTATAAHIEIDNNEIIAKSNGTTEGVLNLGISKQVQCHGGVQSVKSFYGPGIGSAWNKGRDNAKFKITSVSGYTPGISFRTSHGSWEIGAYDNANYYDGLLFTYISDDYYVNTNAPYSQCFFDTTGALYSNSLLTSNITFVSRNIKPNEDWLSGSWIEDGWIYLCDSKVGTIQMGASDPEKQGVRFGTAGFTPITNNTYYLGHSSYKWKQLVAGTTTISTSDRNAKKDFKTFDSDDRYEQLFLDLKPMIFKFKDGESNRDHFGFISQDVEDSLLKLGFDGTNFAGFCKDLKVEDKPEKRGDENFIPILDENGNEQYEYSLRYSEFISLNTYMIQKLYNKIELLEEEIKQLKKFI